MVWTDEQSASIDWTDPDEVLSNGWTFLRLLDFHPALAQHVKSNSVEHDEWRAVFLDPLRGGEQRAALRAWHAAGLLSLRAARWCRRCRGEGHTWRSCPRAGGRADGPSRIMARFAAHQAEVERRKLQLEKQQERQVPLHSRPVVQRRNAPRGRRDVTLFEEDRRRGTVGRIDTVYGIGFIRVADVGDVKFFVDRVDYGVREIAVGDSVTLKIDQSRDYPFAVDICPERSTVSPDDVVKFLHRCRRATQPIHIIKTIMTHTHEWPVVLTVVQAMSTRGDSVGFTNAVYTLIELTTFIGNREPVHTPLLESFLALMLRSTGKSADAAPPFFPGMVLDALRAEGREPPSVFLVDRWVEAAMFVVLLRHHAAAPAAATGAVEDALRLLLTTGRGAAPAAAKRIDAALQRLRAPTADAIASRVIPSAADMSPPPPDPSSAFAARNLPVCGAMASASTEAFVTDHCRLLRADTFEATVRVLPTACFELPGYEPTEETLADKGYVRLYDHVRFMGRVVVRDKDYATPDGYILYVRPKSPMANLATQLLPGTAVCITTGLDRTRIDDAEIFWAGVTSCDPKLLAAGMIVVTPCDSSVNFGMLIERLQRNERMGKTGFSCLMETNIFMAGYKSIIKALGAFVGPLAMPLPMAAALRGSDVDVADAVVPSSSSSAPRRPGDLVAYIPPHCEYAFTDLVNDVKDRFALDAGQLKVMESLSTSEIILVQGPPGTGKSFIGCRVVETYVRYKQLVTSGDILRLIDVDELCSTPTADMLPTVGPIVVITYKNHALDEFLVDLLRCGLWDNERSRIAHQLIGGGVSGTTLSASAAAVVRPDLFPRGKRIVRIGGRSREPALDAFNLGTLLRTKTDKPVLNSLKERLFLLSQRLERLLKEIHYLEAGRVPKALFERWLTEEQRKHMRGEDREDWLLGKQYVGPVIPGLPLPDRTFYLDTLRTQMGAALDEAQRASPSHPIHAMRAPHVGNDDNNVGNDDNDGNKNGTVTQKKKTKGEKEEEEVEEEDGGVPLSVFQEMRREEESRGYNDALHTTYLSAEAIALAQGTAPIKKPDGIPTELLSLWSLHPIKRHEYYAYLTRECIATKARDCMLLMDAMMNVVTIRNHALDEVRLELLQGADVVGLTTTGCAMNQNLLRSLRPSVLIVEEAAEVLESQLLACMTDSLQQFVLIGDHYQLKPKVETFAYEKYNKLNLSLFERLAGRITPICLTEQRRMHPAISRFVRPFYDTQELLDNQGLTTRPFVTASGEKFIESVPGVARRTFFWSHAHPEEEAQGSRSKINTKESKMILKLVDHLTTEGVHQKSVTVITPYLGQCRLLRSTLRLNGFTDVHVSTVDLFQGDESDVIILSLVRTERLTDFLRMRNRMVVCCSRARFAMVLVGSDKLLEQSDHWSRILEILRQEDCIGDKLPITYRVNPGEVAWMEA